MAAKVKKPRRIVDHGDAGEHEHNLPNMCFPHVRHDQHRRVRVIDSNPRFRHAPPEQPF
jgi:hypothetical protein